MAIAADDSLLVRDYFGPDLHQKQRIRPIVMRIAGDIGNENSQFVVRQMLDSGTLGDRTCAVRVVLKILTDDSIEESIKKKYEDIVQKKGWPEEIFQAWNSINNEFTHSNNIGLAEINTIFFPKETLAEKQMIKARQLLEPKIKCSFEEYVIKRKEEAKAALKRQEAWSAPGKKPQVESKKTFLQSLMSCFHGTKYKKSKVLAVDKDF